MKYLKMFGLAAIAATALMAFLGAGSASATVLCSTTTTPCNSVYPVGSNLKWSVEPGTSILLKETGAEGETLDTCTSGEVTGSLTSAGSATTTPHGNISVLNWGSAGTACRFTTTTVEFGGLEVHSITGSSNGTVTSSKQIRVTISIPLFGSCVYGVTAGRDIGTITEGNPSTFDANAIAERLSGSSFACPETSNWTGSYIQTADTSLTTLAVEPS